MKKTLLTILILSICTLAYANIHMGKGKLASGLYGITTDYFLVTEDGNYLLTEDGEYLEVEHV